MSVESAISILGTTMIFLTFLVLKLTGVINWSWWWVTAPLWGGFALAILIVIIILIMWGIMALIPKKG